MAAEWMLKTFAAAILFSGAVTGVHAQQLDAAAPSTEPMPGFRDGDAGARKLRYRCAGEGTPTVLLEPGGDTSFETLHSWVKERSFRPPWLTVISEIEKATRVCVYDRAGVGRSGKAPLPRTSADVATDLHALLRNEKIATPIVCVGQSFGGSNCRIFASRYPELVAGMVLVDTSDADFWTRMKLPGPDLTNSAEWIDREANSALLRNANGIGGKPLIVLTASPTATDPMIPHARQPDAISIHQELQRELLGLSTNSRQVVATKAGHNIQREEPQLIVEAVLEVVKQVRAEKMSNPPRLQSVTPIFQVTNLQRSLDYYTRVLGFAIEWTSGEPPAYASVSRDGVEISLTVVSRPVLSQVYIEVDGVDEYFARVSAAGAKVIVPIADRFYGMRDGRIDDPDGNSIQLGQPIAVEK